MHCVELCWPPPMLQPRLTFYTAKACASVTQWQASLTLLVVWMGADVAALDLFCLHFTLSLRKGLLFIQLRECCAYTYTQK